MPRLLSGSSPLPPATRVALLGCGSLGESLARGLLAQGHPASGITATSRRSERREQLRERYQVGVSGDNRAAAAAADVLLLAVKPAQILELAASLSTLDLNGKLLISVAAGIRSDQILAALGQPAALIRAMPNTPSSIGFGACGLFAGPGVTPSQKQVAEAVFSAVGVWAWVEDEALMDAVTAVAGSGPAYYFAILEAMQAAAEQFGLPSDTARLLVKQTCLGAARLACADGAPDFAALRQAVTSPGGTTAAALKVFAARDLAGTIDAALTAAVARGREMADLAHTKSQTP